MSRSDRQVGFTLLEIMIGIGIAGVLAMLLMPKVLNSDGKTQNVVMKSESIMKTVSSAINLYEASTGNDCDPTSFTFEQIFSQYGNFFVYKQVSTANFGAGDDRYVKYFLLHSGGRVAFSYINPAGVETGYEMLTSGVGGGGLQSLPEYDLNPANALPEPILDVTQWNAETALAPYPATATSTYCGNFPQHECFYMDLNGSKIPNRLGPSGDIIPFRIDPTTNSIRTLYQWERDLGMTEAQGVCQFLSAYDVESGANLGTCPSDQTAWNTAYLCPGGASCL